MYKKMTRDEAYAFVRDNAITVHLGTVREDGRPHVAPVWATVDGEDIVWQTGRDTVKGRNLLRTGYAALSLDDSKPPFDSVRIEGPVTFDEDPVEIRRWAGILGAKYMGADTADTYAERNGVPGEMVCRLRPKTITGLKGVADFHEYERGT